MTGFGEARKQAEGLNLTVELRAINNRYLKVTTRAPEGFGGLESEVESVIREQVKRGTIQVTFRLERALRAEDYKLNVIALSSYREQLETLAAAWNLPGGISPAALLALPGVLQDDHAQRRDPVADWPWIKDVLKEALDTLNAMRRVEGRALGADLQSHLATIARELSAIDELAPLVAKDYRVRLEERVKTALADYAVQLQPGDLIREVSLFAERCDVSEEIVRLRSHLEQFQKTMDADEAAGRKLEFLIQEMFREANTLGSKANDVRISRHMVEIKATIEKMREQVQNLE